MADDSAFIWDRKPVGKPPKRAASAARRQAQPTAVQAVEFGDRITLKEAEGRFGVTVAQLRLWARSGEINAVMGPGPKGGRMWLVTAESIARHLSKQTPAARSSTAPTAPPTKTGPTEDGTGMLVPRDAWDRLMDQLGNLHDAGVQLAEARERAARAETESTFLRERLSELRTERDEFKEKLEASPPPRPTPAGPTLTDRLREAYQKFVGK